MNNISELEPSGTGPISTGTQVQPQCNKSVPNLRSFLSEHLDLSNQELALKLGLGTRQVETLIYGMGLKRTPEQRRAIAVRQNTGEQNPAWKGGVGKNHYHWKKLQVARYPEKIIARRKVYRAVKSGRLKRQPCQHPDCIEQRTFAHHADYSKPLDVTWLCRKHHHELHNNFPAVRQEQTAGGSASSGCLADQPAVEVRA